MKNLNKQMIDAILDCDIEKANDIIQNDDFDINYQDDSGNGFLHYAYTDFYFYGHMTMVQWLLEKHAPYNIKNINGHLPNFLFTKFCNYRAN